MKHGLAATLVLALLAFVAYDMRHAALAYLGINPAKPAVEFEIRLPKGRSMVSDTQVIRDPLPRALTPRSRRPAASINRRIRT